MLNVMNRRAVLWAGVSAVATWATRSRTGMPGSLSPRLSLPSSTDGLTAGQRVIRFPRDRSLGWIEWSARLGEGDDVEARGDVAVPAGLPIRLLTMNELVGDFTELRSLRPDDLTELYCWFGDGMIDLAHVTHLSGLRVLEITDAAVKVGQPSASPFRGLRSLDLGYARLDSACLELACRCPELRRLGLHGSRMRDGDFRALRGSRTLERIDLTLTNVQDDGLIDPNEFPALEQLVLRDTAVSDSRIADFRRRFPHLSIQESGNS